jgi:hypothetical protein
MTIGVGSGLVAVDSRFWLVRLAITLIISNGKRDKSCSDEHNQNEKESGKRRKKLLG